jgi:DMSO/TMAO reductase YedYZ heme-binding membrane subunit
MSEKDLEIRNYVLNCIKIFIEKNDIHKKILCSIIFLYDILTIKNKQKKMLNNSEEIGIGACFLTLKFLCTKKNLFIL